MQHGVMSMSHRVTGRYSIGARSLHWIIALAIGGMFFTDQARDFYDRGAPERDWWLGIHASLGITILALTLVRIFWRLINGAPLPVPASPLMHLAAKLGHLALYGFTFCLPISGFLRYTSSGNDITLFGNTIASPFGKNDTLHNIGELFHNGLWTNLLLAMIGLHVLAALYHQFILKDGTLRRMA
ncbi:MAG TPA: cytochrome b [Dongiaceae bacterium]|nr:cytochrome b [Dongiaceae bacterium]